MARPHGSYRAARRNEARNARKGGARVRMLTYAEVLKINAIAAHNAQRAAAEAAKADSIKSVGGFEPLGPKAHAKAEVLAAASA